MGLGVPPTDPWPRSEQAPALSGGFWRGTGSSGCAGSDSGDSVLSRDSFLSPPAQRKRCSAASVLLPDDARGPGAAAGCSGHPALEQLLPEPSWAARVGHTHCVFSHLLLL